MLLEKYCQINFSLHLPFGFSRKIVSVFQNLRQSQLKKNILCNFEFLFYFYEIFVKFIRQNLIGGVKILRTILIS